MSFQLFPSQSGPLFSLFPTFGGPVPELSAVDRDNGSLSKYLGDKGSNTSKVLTRMTTAALRVTAKGLRGLHSPGFPTHPALHLISRKPAQTSSWQMPHPHRQGPVLGLISPPGKSPAHSRCLRAHLPAFPPPLLTLHIQT